MVPYGRLQEWRRVDAADWRILVLDGTTFVGDQLVIALGITITEEKRIIGLIQTATENKRGVANLSIRSPAILTGSTRR